MRTLRFILCGGALLAALPATAAPPAADVAASVDRRIAAGWEAAKVKPAPTADDAEFLRRVYLDLAGRIPNVTEARQFLDDKAPDRRARLVDKLLAGQNYANHFTNVWRTLLLPEANTSLQARIQLPAFAGWLRANLDRNTGYDTLVRELLTAPILAGPRGGGFGYDNADPTPTAFFFAKELMPENLAAAASRVFLGVKLECAQCHNHPFASWKREEFWSFAAFFAGVKRQGPGEITMAGREDTTKRDIAIPNTTRTANARFLGGTEPTWKDGVSPRETLAEWITRPDNPYFARAAVNRMWAYFFGSGLIDPVDEMVGAEAAVSYPEVLDELAKAFVESKFDLKYLARTIVLTRAYQQSSRTAGDGKEDPRLFARMPLRGLTPEQLFDSVAKATGYNEPASNLPAGVVIGGRGSAREEFLSRFGSSGSERPAEHQTSILQALALMNGRLVSDQTATDRSVLLASVVDAPFFDSAGKLEALYLAALSRRPTAAESERVTRFIDGRTHAAKDDADRRTRSREALADVFWTLLNSAEFMLNH